MQKLRIGFYIDARIGDSVVVIPAIRAIKQFYPSSSLFVFTNKIGFNLYHALSWIDQVIFYQDHRQISACKLDYLISSNCDKNTLTKLKQSNAQKIITYLKLHNLFDFRFKTTFISYRFKPQSQKQNTLDLVNLIAPHTKLKLSEIKDYKLQTLPQHKEHIASFLTPLSQDKKPKIMVNPFGFAAIENLTLAEYEKIIQGLIEDFYIILPTFEDRANLIKQSFAQSLLNHPHFFIFENDSDLLNLVELISKMDLLISPSTGNIHIADNLGIPSIGLFSHKDTIAWGGDFIHPLILDQNPPHQVITMVVSQVQSMLSQTTH